MSKVQLYLRYTLLLVVTTFMVSCSNKLSPLSSSLFTVTPNPMEVRGSKIPVAVNGRFPEKWFNKDVELTITPVLKWNGGELTGHPVTYQGENVAGNEITISYKSGNSFTIKSLFDYRPEMKNPALYLRFTTHIKNKKITLPDIKVAQGLITTETLADPLTSSPAYAPDDFQKIIKQTYDADIHFLLQQATLRSSQLNSTNMEAWKQLVKDVSRNPKQNINIEVLAYSSPDGGYALNEKLSEKREKNTTAYLNKELKKENINTDIYAHYTAQDWEGFKKLVQASSLQDKDLVLRVIEMYNDPVDREREIKNISIIYKDLAQTILPQLRRSRLIANVETIGKTDDELIQTFKSNPSSLTINELLYIATLENSPKEQIYRVVIDKYPNDYRGWNNLGALYYENKEFDKAKRSFLKANSINKTAAEPNMNLGLLAIVDGDLIEAEHLISSSSQASTVGEAIGLLYLKKGDYTKALQAFEGTQSNNAALAQILTNNYKLAQQTLNSLSHKNATTYYLQAIIAARTNDSSSLVEYLSKAIQHEPAYKNYAKDDLEFAKFNTTSAIKNLLN